MSGAAGGHLLGAAQGYCSQGCAWDGRRWLLQRTCWWAWKSAALVGLCHSAQRPCLQVRDCRGKREGANGMVRKVSAKKRLRSSLTGCLPHSVMPPVSLVDWPCTAQDTDDQVNGCFLSTCILAEPNQGRSRDKVAPNIPTSGRYGRRHPAEASDKMGVTTSGSRIGSWEWGSCCSLQLPIQSQVTSSSQAGA